LGTGTTTLAALRNGRNSIGFEIDDVYASLAKKRLLECTGIFSDAEINVHA
jgi:DNA modification methylase